MPSRNSKYPGLRRAVELLNSGASRNDVVVTLIPFLRVVVSVGMDRFRLSLSEKDEMREDLLHEIMVRFLRSTLPRVNRGCEVGRTCLFLILSASGMVTDQLTKRAKYRSRRLQVPPGILRPVVVPFMDIVDERLDREYLEALIAARVLAYSTARSIVPIGVVKAMVRTMVMEEYERGDL